MCLGYTASQLPTPRKIVPFPLASKPNAGTVFLFGESDSPNIAVLCAGYADDQEIFLRFASRLASDAKCLVGVTCLPGYDDRKDFPYTEHKDEGYSWSEMVEVLRQSVKALRKESTFTGEGGAKLTGIFHDWGVAPGSMYCNRVIEEKDEMYTLDQMVLFDVMGPPHPKTKDMPIAEKDTLYSTVVTLTYRIVLAVAYGIRRYISKFLAQVYFIVSFMTLAILRISPVYDIDAQVGQSRQNPIPLDRMIYMAYPYYNMFKDIFTGKFGYGFSLPNDLKKTPVLYMYGTHKPIMFHDKRSLTVLEREEKAGGRSKVVAVDEAGHYLYEQKQDICLEEVVNFVTDA